MATNIERISTAKSNEELLSYIINQDPVLKEGIDLPVQGESIEPIGKIIVNNQRYKNAFLNICNVIGLTVIQDKRWRSAWDNFTEKGQLPMGQSIREVYTDLAKVFDYNEYKDNATHFLTNVVPDVFQYIHDLNYQKFYKTTTSDEEIAMAFSTEGGLFRLIDSIIASLYEGYEYDKYIVEKYMLCRRILDGTLSVEYIANYNTKSTRERVAAMKSVSNKMTFRKPNYNPAGVRNFSAFEDQFFIMNTDFDASMSVDVLATSYFRNDAELKSNMALIDSFGDHDEARLVEVLGNAYIPFSSGEKTALASIPACIIDRNFFQVYNYAFDNMAEVRATELFNPETLKTNHWLHTWKVMSTSPYAPAVVFSLTQPSITSITLSPSSASVYAGQKLQLSATVVTAGFANKALVWYATDSEAKPIDGVSIDNNGLLSVGSDVSNNTAITVTAISVFDKESYGEATITVVNSSTEPTTDTPTEPTTEVTTQP